MPLARLAPPISSSDANSRSRRDYNNFRLFPYHARIDNERTALWRALRTLAAETYALVVPSLQMVSRPRSSKPKNDRYHTPRLRRDRPSGRSKCRNLASTEPLVPLGLLLLAPRGRTTACPILFHDGLASLRGQFSIHTRIDAAMRLL